MKKRIYIALFVFLGILLQFLIHGLVESWYIELLISNFPKYSFGLSWSQWYIIHHILSVILFVAGVWFGYSQGKHWWPRVYEKK